MAKIYYENDVNVEVLRQKKIFIVGFGSQGHAHAMNLHDNGFKVMIYTRSDEKKQKAREYGIPIVSIAEGVQKADLIAILIPDEIQSQVFKEEIAPYLIPGKTILFAHGFSIHFSQVMPPAQVDVIMIAPKGPGSLVRREFTINRGVPALMALYQDYSGQAKDKALAYAWGIGATRAGVIETTFKEECETDLFGEQAVLCGGVTALMKAGFDTLVKAGYQPELAYFECIHEMKLIVDLIYEGGLSGMRHWVSNTAEYGDYLAQDKIITDQSRQNMQKLLDDIQSGRFAKSWILENLAGQPSFQAMRQKERQHLVEKVGKELRQMMPWLKKE